MAEREIRVGWPRRAISTASVAASAAVERRVPFWPVERVERRQRRRLRAIVRHAYETVPYYRETMRRLGLRPEDIATADDLVRLPIVEREQLQHDPEAFASTAYAPERCLRLRSSGSTGASRIVFHDIAALLQNAAHGERDRAMVAPLVGRVGYRELTISSPVGSAYRIRRIVAARTLTPSRVWIERQYVSPFDPPEEIAQLIEAFRPHVIYGYGSTIELLFAHYEAHGGLGHLPDVITFSADALSAAARRTIEEGFGVPVFGTYQAIEALKIGFQCERRAGYHLNADLYPVRVVDEAGRDVPSGETGEVVVSNLVNRATVLLNYRLGDLATLAAAPCPCGRTLPLLASLDGRRDDVIKLPSGRVVNPHTVRKVFDLEPTVWQFQVVQEEPNRFRLAIVAPLDTDRDGLRRRLAAGLVERLGEPVAVEVVFVEAVERTAGGKVRPILSRCPSGRVETGVGVSNDG